MSSSLTPHIQDLNISREDSLATTDPTALTRLQAIAKTVNAEHAAIEAALRDSLAKAVKAGELLLEAKSLVRHGDWLPWLAEHCAFSERTAQNYMRISERYPELAKSATVADLTYRGAIALLAEPKQVLAGQDPQALLSDPAVYAYCEKWWAQGLGWLVDYLLEDGGDALSAFMAWDAALVDRGRTLGAELDSIQAVRTAAAEDLEAVIHQQVVGGMRPMPDDVATWARAWIQNDGQAVQHA